MAAASKSRPFFMVSSLLGDVELQSFGATLQKIARKRRKTRVSAGFRNKQNCYDRCLLSGVVRYSPPVAFKSALDDFESNPLAAIPGLLGKLLYLAGLHD